MPPSFLWDVADYVPALVDANLTGRGGWTWGSTIADSHITSGIVGVFPDAPDKLLVTCDTNHWYEVLMEGPYTATEFGTSVPAIQNPVQIVDEIALPDGSGATVPDLVYYPSGVRTLVKADTSLFK